MIINDTTISNINNIYLLDFRNCSMPLSLVGCWEFVIPVSDRKSMEPWSCILNTAWYFTGTDKAAVTHKGWPHVQCVTLTHRAFHWQPLWLHAWDSSLSAARLRYIPSPIPTSTHTSLDTHTTQIAWRSMGVFFSPFLSFVNPHGL